MAEHFQRHLLLYGWLPRAAVGNYLKTQCTSDEVAREQEVLAKWEAASAAFHQKTALSFEQMSRAEVDKQHLNKLDSIKNDKK
ncbi:hypothetical protein, partial [Pseudomonas sp. GW456-12-1-14-LB2]|uniref:hypothetical protein n=1 Tax=Pseudomonas sp. GW456-12-1-14-LB2 TaxID=2070606 RepID=UPI000CAF0F7D